MAITDSGTKKYPLLSEILALKNLPLEPMYTIGNIAELFSVSSRSVQNWVGCGKLAGRNLPGRWKFLTQDIEDFLEASKKRKC